MIEHARLADRFPRFGAVLATFSAGPLVWIQILSIQWHFKRHLICHSIQSGSLCFMVKQLRLVLQGRLLGVCSGEGMSAFRWCYRSITCIPVLKAVIALDCILRLARLSQWMKRPGCERKTQFMACRATLLYVSGAIYEQDGYFERLRFHSSSPLSSSLLILNTSASHVPVSGYSTCCKAHNTESLYHSRWEKARVQSQIVMLLFCTQLVKHLKIDRRVQGWIK